MAEGFVFDGSFESLNELFRLHPVGTKFLCPACGVELVVALSWEEAGKLQVHPGVYCPTDPKHVFRMFNIRSRCEKELP